MDPRAHKQLVADFYKRGLTGDPAGLDRYFAKGYRDHSFFGDLDGLKAAAASLQEAYPHHEWRIQHCIAEGDRVAVRAVLEIRTGTGMVKRLGSTSFYKVSGGKIVEHWGHGDPLF